MKSNPSNSEGEYPSFATILGEALLGLRPINDLLEHPEFLKGAKRICCSIARNGEKAEELFQDSCLKMLGSEGRGMRFFGWYFTSTRNLFRSQLRKKELAIDETPVEEHPLTAQGVDPEMECLLNEVLEFSNSLAFEHRLAFEYYLEKYSTRQIVEKLKERGIHRSHVTVATWNSETLRLLHEGRIPSVKKAIGF